MDIPVRIPWFKRWWRNGVLPAVGGALLLTVVIEIQSRFLVTVNSKGGFAMAAAAIGLYLGVLHRSWRGLLIGLNGGAVVGTIVYFGYEKWLEHGDALYPDPGAYWQLGLIQFSFMVMIGGLLGAMDLSRMAIIHGVARGAVAGIISALLSALWVLLFNVLIQTITLYPYSIIAFQIAGNCLVRTMIFLPLTWNHPMLRRVHGAVPPGTATGV